MTRHRVVDIGPSPTWMNILVGFTLALNTVVLISTMMRSPPLNASPKHLPRYVDEFSFRLNEGNVKHHIMTRLDSFVKGTAGKRLTYKGLIQ